MEPPLFSRVALDAHKRGTVRYIGPVPSDPQGRTWIGVEWDCDYAGMHNGQGLFTCRGVQRGSFVKPAKLERAVDFATAVAERYEARDEDNVPELVVASRQLHRVESLAVISLVQSRCGLAGDARMLRCLCVQALDLSHTLITLREACAIARALPMLTEFNLADNRLAASGEPLEPEAIRGFESLHSLVLDGTEMPADTLAAVLTTCTSLQVLHLSRNQLDNLHVFQNGPTGLRELYVAHNALNDLAAVLSNLAHMDNLARLVLLGNPLHRALGALPVNAHVQSLVLSETSLADWAAVDALALALPDLVELKIMSVPLFAAMEDSKSRMGVVARLPGLRWLNGSEISPTERTDAERFILKSDLTLCAERRAHLVALHGEPVATPVAAQAPVTFAVEFAARGKPAVTRPVKASVPVRSLAVVAKRLFNAPVKATCEFRLGSGGRRMDDDELDCRLDQMLQLGGEPLHVTVFL